MIYLDTPEYFDLEVTVNGQRHKHRVPTHLRLLDFLRDTLDLTGAKETCGEGECGACTVFLDGQTVNSCLVLAVETHGSEIITIEGLSQGGTLSDLQQAFIDEHGVQCGYCTPGIVLSATQLLREEKHPTRERIRFELAGNICRCTGYQKIFSAVANAACKHREV